MKNHCLEKLTNHCLEKKKNLVVYSTDPSKAVVLVLVLLFVALWFILRGNLFYVLPCVILFLGVFISPFSIVTTSLGEERANLSADDFFYLRVPHHVLIIFLWDSQILYKWVPELTKISRNLL